MSIILAIEPDRRQAAHVSAIVRHRVGAELILADTTEGALDAIGSHVPDLVLVPALLSPQDDAALNAALRVIAAAAHVRTLTIPVFANGVEREERGGLLSRWRRGRSEPTPGGCDPAVFAEQISEYLREAAAERAAVVAPPDPAVEIEAPAPVAEREPVVEMAAVVAESEPTTDVEPAPLPVAAVEAEPIIAALPEPAVEPSPLFAADAFTQPVDVMFEEPVFEFAPAPQPIPESLVDLVADSEAAGESVGADEIGDDEILIDLSDDVEEMSPQTSAEELFDGECVGVYTMPSLDEFTLDDDEPIAALPRRHQDDELEPVSPLDIAEFEDDETIAAFAASIAGPDPIAALTVPAEPAAPIAAAADAEERAVPIVSDSTDVVPAAAAQRCDDGWISMGLHQVWAWPALEGVDAESPSPLASLEEFSDVFAAPLLEAPVALPKPHVVAPAPKADHMEWAELIASLRQDIERRRNQPAPPPVVRPVHRAPATAHGEARPAKRKSTPVQDEWGFFDPHQCGFAALLEKLDQITETVDDADGRRPA